MMRLFLLGIAIAIIIWIIAYFTGTNTMKKDYQKDYEELVKMVREYKVTRRNKAIIRQRFALIRLYCCRDKERLDVLYREFYNRFAAIWQPKSDAA